MVILVLIGICLIILGIVYMFNKSSLSLSAATIFIGGLILAVGLIMPTETKQKSYTVSYSNEYNKKDVDVSPNDNKVVYVDNKGNVKRIPYSYEAKIKYIKSDEQKIEYTVENMYNLLGNKIECGAKNIKIYQQKD